jgi:hypothetical protein
MRLVAAQSTPVRLSSTTGESPASIQDESPGLSLAMTDHIVSP